MNEINVIAPYKYLDEIWVFDDPQKGLTQEAFVGGADTILDQLTSHIPDAANGFILLFSASDFPGSQSHVDWIRAERNGNVYYSADLKSEGWLCPALLRYFDNPPAKLYFQVKPRPKQSKTGSEEQRNG